MRIPQNPIGRTLLTLAALCLMVYWARRFPAASLFVLLVPPVLVINFAHDPRTRNMAISVFVVLWLFVFHYESTRAFYLNPVTQIELPKFKFLFPPAGWIMFYNVDDTYSHIEVYRRMGQNVQLIDPHDIFRTRTFGFDNIHRNVLSVVGIRGNAAAFCQYLTWRFPSYDDFFVMAVYYPSLVKEPHKRLQEVIYSCEAAAKDRR